MAQLQVLGSGYAGTYSNVRASHQSPKRARGKHRGNAVKRPAWRYNEVLDVLMMLPDPNKPRHAKMSPREHAVAQKLQSARIHASTLPSITEGKY